jgi:hypothetical protein
MDVYVGRGGGGVGGWVGVGREKERGVESGAVGAAVEAAIAAGGGDVLPGRIFNLKKKVCREGLVGRKCHLLLSNCEPTNLGLAAHNHNMGVSLCPCAPVQVSFFDPLLQADREVRAGRMECTMQNLADSLAVRTPTRLTTAASPEAAAAAAANGDGGAAADELSTFMVYNMRRKVRSRSVTLLEWVLRV